MNCAVCNEETPERGLFTSADTSIPSPLCFSCIFVNILRDMECGCGFKPCSAVVGVETGNGKIAAMAVCPACVAELNGQEFEVVTGHDRIIIPESPDTM